MDVSTLLCDTAICRLCGEENDNGIPIFGDGDDNSDISPTINKYLPIKVDRDGAFPNILCPGCNIQIEATKAFFDLIITGQQKLRQLHAQELDNIKRQEKQKQEFENVLKVVNPNSSMQTYSVQADDNGEQIYIQVLTDGPLFSPDHEMSLRVEGLEKPKRKKGRPLKALQNAAPPPEPEPVAEDPDKQTGDESEETDGKKKRRIKKPVRYSELIQGKELERIFKEQGVIDEDDFAEPVVEVAEKEAGETNEIIGHMEGKDGENLGQLVMVKGGSKVRLKCKNNAVASSPKKKEKYDCDLCGRSFLHLSRLEIHKSFHKNIKYQCGTADCDRNFETKTALDEHQNETQHAGSSLIECLENYGQVQLLPQVNPDEAVITETGEESKVNASESKITCDMCNKTFTCQRNYNVHVKAVHENQKPYGCDKCDKKFPYLNSLKSHMLTHNVKAYPCKSCDKVFQHPSSLVYHREAEHNNGRKFVCNKCKKEFKHKQLLLRHQVVHSNERPHGCTYCGMNFKTRANLLTHMPTHTGVKKHCCTLCGQSFSHKTSLTLHLRWHKGQKPFECDVCLKKFSQRGNLVEHQRIHTGEKPFYCTFCGRNFTTSSQFKLHMKRHSGERPWKCEYCSKQFLHKDTWRNHTRRHRNERPFQCQQCFRGFTEQWSLKKHERLHTGEKPYKCDVCGKAFADTSNLTKHKKIHARKQKNEESKTDTSNIINVSIAGTGEQDSNDILYVTYQDNSPCDQGTLVHIVDTMNANNGEKIDDAFFTTDIQKEIENDVALDIQLQQLVDNDGNAFSLTTDDGQQIKIVSTMVDDEQSIQGLLPDGTLIPINLATQDGKPITTEVEPKKNVVEIKDNILLLPHNTPQMDDDLKMDLAEQKLQFLSEDGQTVCFISPFNSDGNYIGIQ